ncbi:MAG: hypothetical protein WC974_09150 [Thermoplasmata archaeon]
MKRILLVLLLITGSLFAQTFEQRYGLLQPPSIFKRLGTTVSTVGTTDNVSLYTLSLGGATIGSNALAVTGTSFFGDNITFLKTIDGTISQTIANTSTGSAGITALFIRQTASNNLGLHYIGSGYTTSGLIRANSAYIAVSNGATNGIILNTELAAPIILASNNAGKVLIDANGVTLGTTTQIGSIPLYAGAITSTSLVLGATGSQFTQDITSNKWTLKNDAASPASLVTVDSTGNVGIGTTAPNARLSLGNGMGSKLLVYDGGTVAQGGNGYGAGFAVDIPAGNAFSMLTHNDGFLTFGKYTNNNDLTTETEWMRISNTGNVGIATTNPLATFHDNGTAMFGAGTGASLTDSSLVINYTTGSPVLNWYGTDGDTWNLGINTSDYAVFSGATQYTFDNDLKIDASLWGSAQMSGTDAFTTTATADTATVTGATVNDIYILTYITAVTAAEAPLSVTATATGFIATRPAGTTSGASYAWMRQRK